mmetsp:Transcript_26111/g.73037  ORF Transcript_26111/g.73037 Transcript_26111/m.73037 type:complete len:240 (+) Transcript_26111:85-804(+)
MSVSKPNSCGPACKSRSWSSAKQPTQEARAPHEVSQAVSRNSRSTKWSTSPPRQSFSGISTTPRWQQAAPCAKTGTSTGSEVSKSPLTTSISNSTSSLPAPTSASTAATTSLTTGGPATGGSHAGLWPTVTRPPRKTMRQTRSPKSRSATSNCRRVIRLPAHRRKSSSISCKIHGGVAVVRRSAKSPAQHDAANWAALGPRPDGQQICCKTPSSIALHLPASTEHAPRPSWAQHTSCAK